MAGGWTKDGAVQDQIDASVEDEIRRARSQLINGDSALVCEECDCDIPEARRKALPGVQLCVACQAMKWSNPTGHLVKVVKLACEVKHDNSTTASKIRRRVQKRSSCFGNPATLFSSESC